MSIPESTLSPDEAYFPSIPPVCIELSSKCNLKCPYCSNSTLARDHINMDTVVIERIIEQCKLLNLTIGGFHGVGEPLLRKDLEGILTRFHENGIWNGVLITNGTLLTPERMNSLRNAGVVYIYISLDTLDEGLYRRTRGGQLSKTIANAKAAAVSFPEVAFCVGLMNHKEQTITTSVERRFNEIFGALTNVKLLIYENGRFPGAAEDWRRSDYLSETCQAPASYLSIDARGLIALCCADQNSEHVMGDIKEQTIHDVWYDKKNQETFRNIALGVHGCPQVCFKCILRPTSKNLASVDPILYAAMSLLIAKADHLLGDGDIKNSQRLYEHALTRDPHNTKLKVKVSELVAKSGQSSKNYFQNFVDQGRA